MCEKSEMMSKINEVLQSYRSIIDVEESREYNHLLYDLTTIVME